MERDDRSKAKILFRSREEIAKVIGQGGKSRKQGFDHHFTGSHGWR
jgi:hypothetical protein